VSVALCGFVNGHFDKLKVGDRLKGILVGIDKIVLNCIVVAMYILRACCLVELDSEGLSEVAIAETKDCVFLSDDGHKSSMVSVNSDVDSL